jgi:large subunit ribosomal protein L18
MKQSSLIDVRRKRRRLSVRNRLSRSGPVVRLSVHRSAKHIYAQIVDENTGRTVTGIGSASKKLAGDLSGKSKSDRASFIGKEIARLALEKGVESVVFDRGDCKYHGRVKALAEAAREGGLKF